MSLRVELDLVRDPRPMPWAGLALLLLSLSLMALIWHRQLGLDGEKAVLVIETDRIASAKTDIEKKLAARNQQAQLSDKVAALWHSQQERVDALLIELESVWNPDLALLRIDYQRINQRVRLTVLVKNRPAMVTFLQSIQANPHFDKLTLQRHSVHEQDFGRPLELVVLFGWRPDLSAAATEGSYDDH